MLSFPHTPLSECPSCRSNLRSLADVRVPHDASGEWRIFDALIVCMWCPECAEHEWMLTSSQAANDQADIEEVARKSLVMNVDLLDKATRGKL